MSKDFFHLAQAEPGVFFPARPRYDRLFPRTREVAPLEVSFLWASRLQRTRQIRRLRAPPIDPAADSQSPQPQRYSSVRPSSETLRSHEAPRDTCWYCRLLAGKHSPNLAGTA